MTKANASLHSLKEGQNRAVQPDEHIWLSASAGTGKTQVLTARVFRLLLQENVQPEDILCLTFTKAGAAEMADRIYKQLARWVRMDDPDLAQDLRAIGASSKPAVRERARTLFARVLDAPGGGIRIMTIHSFCQTLLSAFPEEAGLQPLVKPLEERDQKIMARQALADMLVNAERDGDAALLLAVQKMSIRLGEEETERYLMRCASQPAAMEALPSGILPHVRALLALPRDGTSDDIIAESLEDRSLDLSALEHIKNTHRAWGTSTGQKAADAVSTWMALPVQQRGDDFEKLHRVFATAKGDERKVAKGLLKADPDIGSMMHDQYLWSMRIMESKSLLLFADFFAEGLLAGRAFYDQYDRLKKLRGVVDFDDMIRRTAHLLSQSHMADWIRYKLDQRTDHILVDEAQDTNQAQWDIIRALAEEYFAGEGAGQGRLRTLFTVGDFKQAIFGFQGTSPHNYMEAFSDFSKRAENAGQKILALPLAESFRSSPPILNVVDRLIADIDPSAMGLSEEVPEHRSFHKGAPGSVTLFKAVAHGEAVADDGEESWLSDEKRSYAQKMALQIKAWLTPGSALWLERKGRYLQPGDIMILVSKRDELSQLLVARLYAEQVPVAGIDRIQLDQPLVVQDLMAALRFVLQPEDDLNLANLLVSPLMGWSQDDLLQYGYRGPKFADRSLWRHVRAQPEAQDKIAPLFDMLNMADFNTVYQFLETLLSGALGGRKKLIARLGVEALDPLEEFLSAALSFEREHISSLQGFVEWFDKGKVEIKREQLEGADAVRVMTVHGAKGLQAPLVILANATFDPERKRSNSLNIQDPMEKDRKVDYPVVPVRKSEQHGLLKSYVDVANGLDMQEHWRLLYVAMTRAEEHLVIGGVLGPAAADGPPQDSWYSKVETALDGLHCDWVAHDGWGAQKTYAPIPFSAPAGQIDQPYNHGDDDVTLPAWIEDKAPIETRPPRPLSPSSTGPDDAKSPPPSPAMQDAARRGLLLHSLFQHLPDVLPENRSEMAHKWLEKQKNIRSKSDREELIQHVSRVLEMPGWEHLFSDKALAEAPIAAVVNDNVVSGVVDRLLVEEDRILVVDYKTARAVPDTEKAVPLAYKRQMASYAFALQKIFPDRQVSAALLYSHAPKLMLLSDAAIERHKPSFERP